MGVIDVGVTARGLEMKGDGGVVFKPDKPLPVEHHHP